jgi:hypothetical protein
MQRAARWTSVCLLVAASVACASPARAPLRMASHDAPEEPEVAAPAEEPTASTATAEDDGDPEADDAYDYRHESLGELDFELDTSGVEAVLGAPAQKTPVAEQATDGSFATTWVWPAR